jgi:hypothetical protein
LKFEAETMQGTHTKDTLMIAFHHADAIEWANAYQGAPFMALFCDAPYEMGFMSRSWDASGIAFDPETWKAFARILYPGAYLFVFAGTLNDDLISLAMRNAGLRKHHRAMSYCYGSGFPKATRIDTQIDKRAGVKRRVIGRETRGMGYHGANDTDITTPMTDLARQWAGHRYGGQALKPSLEPILIFQKPYDGKPAENIVATGAGALNVDMRPVVTAYACQIARLSD